jgi:hypothetical protein
MNGTNVLSDLNSPQSRRGRRAAAAYTRWLPPVLLLLALSALCLAGAPRRAAAADRLLFCNRPERIRLPGAYADAPLVAGRTYTVFLHYRNGTRSAGPMVIALQGSRGRPITLDVRKGVADPRLDPSLAGRQAMARFLSAPSRRYVGKGGARFPIPLKPKQVASGVITVRTNQDARLRIYFRHNRWTVPQARVIALDAPRREVPVVLSPDAKRHYYRIGVPEAGMNRRLDGTYGLLYAFKVDAPPGRKVRVSFSPRGGKAGLVGSMGGVMRQSRIVGTAGWAVFNEVTVGKSGIVSLTTSPFGGVFYPVELLFQLL